MDSFYPKRTHIIELISSSLANESDITYSEDGKIAYLRWEIKVTLPKGPEGGFVFPNARIIDRIFTGHGAQTFLNDNQHPVRIKYPDTSGAYDSWPVVGSGSNGTIATDDFTENGKAGTQITYAFAPNHPKTSASDNAVYILSYYTKVSLDVNVNDQVDAQNKAWFDWYWGPSQGPGGSGPGSSSDNSWHIGEVSVTKNIAEKYGLLAKDPDSASVDYDHSMLQDNSKSDYIKWKIVVNERQIDLKNSQLVLTDTVLVPEDHEFIIGPSQKLEIKITPYGSASSQTLSFSGYGTDSDFTLTQKGNGFELRFPPSPDRIKFEISFYSLITNDKRGFMYRNASSDTDRIPFRNKAELKVTDGGNTTPLDVTATKYYRLQMLDKSAASFNYEDRTLTYTLQVNRNRLPLPSGTILTEVLPNGLVLFPNDASTFSVNVLSTDGATNGLSLDEAGIQFVPQPDGKGFALTLPATPGYEAGSSLGFVGDAYEITYTTRLTDDFLKVTANPIKVTLTNKAILGIANKDPIEDRANTPITYKTLDKQPDNYLGGDTVDWSISINPGQVDLGENVWIKDKLPPELKLVGDIKLFKANVNQENGSLSKASGNPETLDPEPSYDESENALSLKLPSGKQAYILEFSTFIKEDNVSFTNTIKLEGFASNGGDVEGTSDRVTVTNRYSSGGLGTYVLQVRKLDEKGDPMPGVLFQLQTQDGSVLKRNGVEYVVDTNNQGIAKFEKLPYWAFSVKEKDPPTGYLSAGLKGPVRPSAPAGDLQDQPIDVVIQNFPALADIRLRKVNPAETPLSTGKFSLYELDGDSLADLLRGPIPADSEGWIEFVDIPIGDYIIKEEEPPPGYADTGLEIPVTVAYDNDKTSTVVIFYPEEYPDGVSSYDLVNEYDGQIKITKYGETQDGSELLPGVTFGLFVDKDGDKVPYYRDNKKYEVTTDEDGEALFKGLPPGTYYVQEVAAPGEYVLDDTYHEFEITFDTGEDGTPLWKHEERLTNDLLRADFTLTKINPDEGRLGDVQFGIFKGNDTTPLDTKQTDAQGIVTFEGLLPGTYYIRELETPAGYKDLGKDIEVSVELYGTNQIKATSKDTREDDTLINEWDGQIIITKKGSGSLPLKDVTFALFKENQDGIKEPFFRDEGQYELTTESDGIVKFEGLPPGIYYVLETAAPNEYGLPGVYHRFEVSYGYGNKQEPLWQHNKTVYNYLLTDSVILTKTDPNGAALDGGWFGLFSSSAATGEPFMKVQAVGGQVVFTGLGPGTYYVRELEAPEGFIKSDDIIPVTVSLTGRNGISGEVVKAPMVNHWAGRIKLVKLDEKGEPLAGAVFELLDADKKVVKTGTSGKDGVIEFTELAMGTYYLREKTAPSGYAKLEDLTEVVLKGGSEADMFKSLEFENKKMATGKVTVKKVNKEGELLTGGYFAIYKAEDTGFTTPLQKVAAVDGIILFTGLEAGDYVVKELEAPAGYYMTNETVKVTVGISEDNELVDGMAKEDLVNDRDQSKEDRKAKVTLKKVNQYGRKVKGGLFGIYWTDDIHFANPVKTATAVDGLITFEDLEAGEYYIREIEAPEHHILTDEFVKVVVAANSETGLLEDVEIEEPLLNRTPLTLDELDEIEDDDEDVDVDDDDKDDDDKDDDDLVETGGFFDKAMLWFFGTLLMLAGAILLLRMRADLLRR